MAAEKSILVNYDFGSVAKIKALPAASANGEAVRYDEFSEVDTNVNDLVTLSGAAENASHLGTFTGSTIADNTTIKAALQSLETEAEANNLTVASGSSGLLSISNNEISVNSLLVSDTTVDTSETTLANYITNEASAFAALKEGDILILTAASDTEERTWIHNGGSAGDANDMTRLQSDLNQATIRAMVSAVAGELTYSGGAFGIAADAITSAKLADDAVDSEHITDGSVDLAHMSANSVDSDQYVDGSLEFAHIDAATYTTDISSSATSSQLARADAIKTYVDSKTYMRKLFSQSLTSNTAASLNHALAQKFVHVQMFDSDDASVDFELVCTDANNCSVEVTHTGTYSIIVIG